MLMLGMLEGLRAHEVAKLHSDDVSAEGLWVRGKGGREAVLPTHPEILRLSEERSGYWFPGLGSGHVQSDTVSLRISKLFASLGITGSFHRCRHYYGTSLLRAGVNLRVVQELMRHASLATTAAYLGVDENEKQAAIHSLVA
jgi:integrase